MSVKDQVKVIDIDKDKCVNCHLCINACPVKYCNDGSGDVVEINKNLCIACGNCLAVCTHDSRYYIDDFTLCMADLAAGEKMVAIVAPSIAANFHDTFLNINGWLKSLGVEAVFDVSFGAELTVASYLHHIKTNNPKTIIAQPCAAIVSFIEIFKPELIKHLAPVDSPMLHTMKLIRNFYTQYQNHRIVVISPCIAKKREFIETGYGDYNVSFLSIHKYLTNKNIDLESFPKVGYDNPPAERAVLFSSPGGLMRTVERWVPEIRNRTRKIEGISNVYEYLETLPVSIENSTAPLLIDCLNCEKGCNGGPLTMGKDMPVDQIEHWVSKRNKEMQSFYKDEGEKHNVDTAKHLEKLLLEFWNDQLYTRSYNDLSEHYTIKTPNEAELQDIYRKMHKYSEKDIYNCSACGYTRCERMATAIFNGLNKPENCHFYLSTESEIAHKETQQEKNRILNILSSMLEGFIQINTDNIVVASNQSIKDILGIDLIDGRSIFELFDETNQKIVKNNIQIVNRTGRCSYEIQIQNSKGKTVYCLFNQTVLKDQDNNKIGSFVIVTDLTEQKNAELELLKAKDELEDRVVERTQELTACIEELKQAEEEIVAQRDAIEVKAASVSQALAELQKAHNNAKISENNFFSSFYKSTDAVLLLDNATITHCNQTAVQFFRAQSSDDIIGLTPIDFSPEYQPDGNESLMSAEKMIHIALDNGFNRFEWVHKRLDDTTFPTEISLSMVALRGKTFIQAVMTDLTQKKLMELKLQEQQDEVLAINEELRQTSEEVAAQRDNLASALKEVQTAESKISAIVQCMPDAVLVIDSQGTVLLWNEAMEQLTNVKAENIIGKGDYEYSLPFYKERRKALIDLVFEPIESFEKNYTYVLRNGDVLTAESHIPHLKEGGMYIHSTATALKDHENRVIGAIEIVRDITERVQNEKKIKEQQEEVIVANEELRQNSEELATQRDLLQSQNEKLASTLDLLEKSQSKIVESEKMVALGQLIAGVAHEINTPLGAIRSSVGNITSTLEQVLTNLPDFFGKLQETEKKVFFDLLERSMNAPQSVTSKEERAFKRSIIKVLEEENIETADEYADTLVDMGIYSDIVPLVDFFRLPTCAAVLQMAYKISGLLRSSKTISTATERASKVVFALKNFAHYDHSGETSQAHVSELIETVLTLYHNQLKHGVTVIKNYADVPAIQCYPDELNQVWTNILHNALQAMDLNGTLQIDITQDDVNIYVAFTDSGKGVPVEIQDKIFNAFFTTKPQGEGSGLGLDIVRRIIEKHLGSISFTSQPGQTTFTVQLPKR